MMTEAAAQSRSSWSSRLGVILAVSGSAVSLGKILRFPRNAPENGGGAFLIPYSIAFLLLAIATGASATEEDEDRH